LLTPNHQEIEVHCHHPSSSPWASGIQLPTSLALSF
jgi:hypothetical protein